MNTTERRREMKCSQMIISEVLADDHIKELVTRMEDHVRDIPELVGHSILVEEGGRMVILLTHWKTRQDCMQYYASRAYRQFVGAATQHMIVGSYVVKLFENRSDAESITTVNA
jgi:heme-degrading monooxygenase HmoA